MNCIFLACYVPSKDKEYVIKDIFTSISKYEKKATVYVGIQSNSIEDTERFLVKHRRKLKIVSERVPEELLMDSDASAFQTALRLYSKSKMEYDKCFFCHTKGITTGMDDLRRRLYEGLFNPQWYNHLLYGKNVGSYGPCLTITDVQKDIDLMSSVSKFKEFQYKPMEYYYCHTFYLIKNALLKKFVSEVDESFFITRIDAYSDRYFFERDFIHIVDMMGQKPSYQQRHGNYSTNFVPPSVQQIDAKFAKWEKQ